MHSHIHAVGPNLFDTYSARALDKSESAQRAAGVRKKLLGAPGEIEVESGAEEDWLVRPGYEAAGYGGGGRRGLPPRADVEVEEAGTRVEPISVWA